MRNKTDLLKDHNVQVLQLNKFAKREQKKKHEKRRVRQLLNSVGALYFG